MFLFTLSLLASQLAPLGRLLRPPDLVAIAVADLSKQPQAIQPYLRYLSLHNIPELQRLQAAKVMSGHVNGLSRQPEIVIPSLVGGVLLRVNIGDYGWNSHLWETLADVDPYFHVKLNKDSETVIAPAFTENPKASADLEVLVAKTGSKAPLLRADWFFNQTAAQVDRKPGYYDFLRVKNQQDYYKAIGFNSQVIDDVGLVELREAVAVSGVTLQPRALARMPTIIGGFWYSVDFKKALDKNNPLRVLGAEIERNFDASEQFGHLPNGFWATALFNKNGERQDTAPDFIASDHQSKSNDRRVHVNVSCLRCHSNGGLQDIDGWARNLFQSPLKLQSADYEGLKKLRQQYLRRLEPFLERDRSIFAAAVKEATGLPAKDYAQAYGDWWERYEDAKVDITWAAADLGVNPEMLRTALEAYVKTLGSLDTVLSVMLLQGARSRAISIRQWEEAYPLAYLALKGYKS